jgi:hypothetical protein
MMHVKKIVFSMLLLLTLMAHAADAPKPAVLATASAAEATVAAAGQVIVAIGQVFAVDAKNAKRPLARGDHFYASDTILTEDKSNVSLRFIDNTLLDLKEKSTYKIVNYHFNEKQPEKDSYSAELIEGGFRTITGALGKRNPDNYEVKARMTTLTIRGTSFGGAFSPVCQLNNDGTHTQTGGCSASVPVDLDTMEKQTEVQSPAPSEPTSESTTDESSFVVFVAQQVVDANVDGKEYTLTAGKQPGLEIRPDGTVVKIDKMPTALVDGFIPGGFKGLKERGEQPVVSTSNGNVTLPGNQPTMSGSPCENVSGMSM